MKIVTNAETVCKHMYLDMGYVYIHKEDTFRMYFNFLDIPVDERKDFWLYTYQLCNHCTEKMYTLQE